MYGDFKQKTDKISHKNIWTWLRKGNFKRETESLQIATQNDTIRTNYVKAKIDKMQQNSKCILCGDRDKTINKWMQQLKKLSNMWMMMMMIPIIIVVLRMVSKGLVRGLEELEIRGCADTIETAVLLRSAWILRGILLPLRLLWKTIR